VPVALLLGPGIDDEVTDILSSGDEAAPAGWPGVRVKEEPGAVPQGSTLAILLAEQRKLELEIQLEKLRQLHQQQPHASLPPPQQRHQQQQPMGAHGPAALVAPVFGRAPPPPRAGGVSSAGGSRGMQVPHLPVFNAGGGGKRIRRDSFDGYGDEDDDQQYMASGRTPLRRAGSATGLMTIPQAYQMTVPDVRVHYRMGSQWRDTDLDTALMPSHPTDAPVCQFVMGRLPVRLKNVYCFSCGTRIREGDGMFSTLGEYEGPTVRRGSGAGARGGVGVVPFCSPNCVINVPTYPATGRQGLVDRSRNGGLPLPRGMAKPTDELYWDKDRVVLSNTLRGELAAGNIDDKFHQQMVEWAQQWELPAGIQEALGLADTTGAGGDDND
jgi:hypothetical protein